MKSYCTSILLFLAFPVLAADTLLINKQNIGTLTTILDNAPEHSVIQFEDGHYYLHDIIISKSLTLTGSKNAILDGGGKGSVLILQGRNIHVKGLTIKRTGYTSIDERAGIRLLSAYGCIIEQTTIEDCCFGISVVNGSNCVIKNNTISAKNISEQRSGNGIHAWKSDSLTIKSNNITGHRDGIYFEFVTKTGVYKNISTHNVRYGIHFMFSNDDEYLDNTFSSNGSGVAVMFSNHVRMMRNTFSDCMGAASYGILLKEINDSEINSNKFIRNTNGVYMEGTNRVSLINNAFISNGWACRVQASCSSVMLRGNNFISNSFDVATNGSLAAQDFNGNYWDKYEGYDLNENGEGDVPYSPVSMYSMIVERMPYALMLYRSFMVYLLDRSEKVMPGFSSEQVKDYTPAMQAFPI